MRIFFLIFTAVAFFAAQSGHQPGLSGASSQQNGAWPTSAGVPQISLASISLSPANPTQVSGSAVFFTAIGTYSDGSTKNVAQSVTWSTGTPAVAVFGSLGAQQAVTCVAAGTSVITATSGSVSGSTILTCTTAVTAGCGTTTAGMPTDNSQCGAGGTNAYAGEGGATDLTSWCGGSLPGSCTAVSTCVPSLTQGTPTSHKKYYLTTDLNCGNSALALSPTKYVDFNLNGHTITGVIFLNATLRGFHFFNGTLNCNLTAPVPTLVAPADFAYACLDNENNGGSYVTSAGGGDQILIHHISGFNGNTSAWYLRFTGKVTGPGGGWTEPILVVYNNTFQAQPETSSNRQHAGIYSETAPIEYYNNRGDVGSNGQANAAQLLEIYGNGGQDPYPNYIHNNYLTCELFSVSGGDSCRPVLCDGQHYCHIQFNDIWASNNRCMRLRDAFNAEVDYNYCHAEQTKCWNTGDSDVGSGIGQSLNQNIHNNTCELGPNGTGLALNGQQGVTLESNTFLCAAGGCSGATIVSIGNTNQNFGSVTVSASAKTFTCSSCAFTTGTGVKAGSVIAFSGFANAANNNIFTVTLNSATVITVSDPSNLLVDEACASGCKYNGISQANLFNSILGAGMPSAVVINGVSGQPASTTLNYCGQSAPTVSGTGGTLTLVGPPARNQQQAL